jgi:hypothetical protein
MRPLILFIAAMVLFALVYATLATFIARRGARRHLGMIGAVIAALATSALVIAASASWYEPGLGVRPRDLIAYVVIGCLLFIPATIVANKTAAQFASAAKKPLTSVVMTWHISILTIAFSSFVALGALMWITGDSV